MHVISQKKLKIPLKDNLHYPGVNIDDCLGPIIMPLLDAPEVMRVLYREKPALYGYARLKPPMGKSQTMKTLLDETGAGGLYEATWNGTDYRGRLVASGRYIYQLRIGAVFTATERVTLLK